MTKAMYPGSFDPITLGHMDLIKRSSLLFDEVYVALQVNPSKKSAFSVMERIDMIRKSTAGLNNVKVVVAEGLTVQYAKQIGCKVIIRGVRSNSDYEYEMAQASTNKLIENEVETLFMVADPALSLLSSSMVKEVAAFRGTIDSYIPEEIRGFVKNRLDRK